MKNWCSYYNSNVWTLRAVIENVIQTVFGTGITVYFRSLLFYLLTEIYINEKKNCSVAMVTTRRILVFIVLYTLRDGPWPMNYCIKILLALTKSVRPFSIKYVQTHNHCSVKYRYCICIEYSAAERRLDNMYTIVDGNHCNNSSTSCIVINHLYYIGDGIFFFLFKRLSVLDRFRLILSWMTTRAMCVIFHFFANVREIASVVICQIRTCFTRYNIVLQFSRFNRHCYQYLTQKAYTGMCADWRI